jgi:hypothetical protein
MSSNRGKPDIDQTDSEEEDGQVHMKEEALLPSGLKQTTLLPSKKRKSTLIEGVSTASLVSLQAQLFQAQQQADPTNRHPKPTSSRCLRLNDERNRGIESRIAKDLATQPPLSSQDRIVQSRTALERKAKLYDELSKDKHQRRDDDNDDDDDDTDDDGILKQYQVDFLMKHSDPIIYNNSDKDNNDVNETRTAQVFASNAHHFVASTRTYTEEAQQEQASTRTVIHNGDDNDERVEQIETLRQIADATDREKRRIEMKRKEQEGADEKKKEELKRAYLKKQLRERIGKGGMKKQQQ